MTVPRPEGAGSVARPAGRVRSMGGARGGVLAWAGLLALLPVAAAALNLSNQWLSPRNAERAVRNQTRYLILHTTESRSASALPKLQRNGEAHYLVDEVGKLFRIVDRRRVAYHCGRSMWDGRQNLDLVSVGIEVAGYHNRDLNTSQIQALAGLVAELQRIYRIPDERVLPHSMVAYGAPNRWHPRNHRGRKRCGMQFARDDLRLRLGLRKRPLFDPDVRAGRLVNADPILAAALFRPARPPTLPAVAGRAAEASVIQAGRTAWDIARERYNHPDTRYVFPDGTERRGDAITAWNALPAGTRVILGDETGDENAESMPRILGRDGDTPGALAGTEWNQPRTLYLFADGRLVAGDALTEAGARGLPAGTRVWIGYRIAGPVTSRRRAFDICGPRWDAPDTFYLFPDGALTTGDAVDERRLPNGTRILLRVP